MKNQQLTLNTIEDFLNSDHCVGYDQYSKFDGWKKYHISINDQGGGWNADYLRADRNKHLVDAIVEYYGRTELPDEIFIIESQHDKLFFLYDNEPPDSAYNEYERECNEGVPTLEDIEGSSVVIDGDDDFDPVA